MNPDQPSTPHRAPRVLLTGGRAPATLELARILALGGAQVFVADSQYGLTQGSSAITAAFRVPQPRLEPRAFVRALAGIVQRAAIDLLVPTCEEIFWVMLVLEEPEFAALRARTFAPDLETLHVLHNKWRFAALMEGLGVRTPHTRLLESQADLEGLGRDQRFVLKPVYSRFAARTQVLEPGAQVAQPPRITRAQPWLAQAFITGEELCAFAVARAGQVAAFCAYRPAWRVGLGSAVAFEALPISDPRVAALLAAVQRVVAHLNFTGQIAFDAMHDGERLFVLECNPRITSGVHLFAPADHLERAYLGADMDARGPIMASGGSACLGVPMLLYALPGALEASRRAVWGRLWRESRDVLRDPADPLSAAHQLRCLAEPLRAAWRLGCGPLEATTADLEWNGEGLEPDGEPQVALAGADAEHADSGFRMQAFLRGLEPPDAPIENVRCTWETLRVDEHLLPVSVSRNEPDAAYVVSPYTHYVTYAQDELRELQMPGLERVAHTLLTGLGAVLRWGEVDRVVFVNNLPVSTNLHPALRFQQWRAITDALVDRFPDAAVAVRSVHGRDSRLPEFLRALGYRLVPARSVTFVPTLSAHVWRKRDVRQDARLLEDSPYRMRRLSSPTDAELERIAELYTLLYIHKYSRHNPRFTSAFMGLAARTGTLEFIVLERAGRMDGVIGFYTRAGCLTVPVLGYDTRLPKETGLYRMLSSLIAREAHARGVELHASSGVAAFKRSRGGEAELEYTAVYDAHLGARRRFTWALLEGVVRAIAVPLVRGRGL